MDYIHIEKLKVRGKHGVNARERVVEQEFEIMLRLGVDSAKAAASDTLNDTLNYSEVRDAVVEIVQNNSYYLIEKLADHIVQALLADSRVLSAEVSVRKTEVWDNGVPGVTLTRIKVL